jgi:hypothetical protein
MAMSQIAIIAQVKTKPDAIKQAQTEMEKDHTTNHFYR